MLIIIIFFLLFEAHDQPDVYETNDLPEAEQGNLSMSDAIVVSITVFLLYLEY